MKKSLIPLLFLVANFVLLGQSPSLTLLKPCGGEDWLLGSQQRIKWLATNLRADATVKLSLIYGGTFLGTIATGVPAQSCEYS
jgi:hypothetical protein